jgi:hypothetical protein
MINLPSGCKFHPRCPFATEKCIQQEPELEPVGDGHFSACWHWREVEKELEGISLHSKKLESKKTDSTQNGF